MNDTEKQKIEDISLNWADQIKETEILRWKIMYGFTPKELADHYLSILDKTIKSKLEAVEGDLIEQAEPYDDAKWHNRLSIETIKNIINKHK